MQDTIWLLRVQAMPFELTDAPTIFCTLINKVLQPFHDKFIVVYLDGTIYSQILEAHVEHLHQVFPVLRENELYIKKEKCCRSKSVTHLVHIIGTSQVNMDQAKV